jgi:hypothetical protein
LEGRIHQIHSSGFEEIYEVKQNPQCGMYAVRRERAASKFKPAGEFVTAFNSRYAFTVSRAAANQPWTLESVQEGTDWPSLDAHPTRRNRADPGPVSTTLIGLVSRCGELVGVPIPTAGSEFEVPLTDGQFLRTLSVSRAGPGRLEVRFESRTPTGNAPYAGAIVVDPDHYYCLKSFDYGGRVSDGSFYSRTKIEYSISDSGLPIPVFQKSEGKLAPINTPSTSEVRYELREPAQSPADEEFTLSAFGLPEPQFKKTNWWLWACLLMVILGLAFGTWKFFTRQRSHRHAK